jgi:hypothetical protein
MNNIKCGSALSNVDCKIVGKSSLVFKRARRVNDGRS